MCIFRIIVEIAITWTEVKHLRLKEVKGNFGGSYICWCSEIAINYLLQNTRETCIHTMELIECNLQCDCNILTRNYLQHNMYYYIFSITYNHKLTFR